MESVLSKSGQLVSGAAVAYYTGACLADSTCTQALVDAVRARFDKPAGRSPGGAALVSVAARGRQVGIDRSKPKVALGTKQTRRH